MLAATLDLKTGASRKFHLAQFERDDHNNPALLAVEGKPLVAFYSRHDPDDALRIRISSRPLDIAEWGEERVLHFNGMTCYAQVHALGDELHLFTRVDETRWGYARSPDWAQSWSPARDFLRFDTDQQVYMATALLPRRQDHARRGVGSSQGIREEAAARCLGRGRRSAIGRGDAAVLGQGHRQPAGRQRVAARLSRSRACREDAGGSHGQRDGRQRRSGVRDRLHLQDQGRPLEPRCAVQRGRAARRRVAARNGCARGRRFGYIHAGFYVGGMAFPDRSPGGQVYVTREEGGLWSLERWDRDAAGQWQPQRADPAADRRASRGHGRSPIRRPGLAVTCLALERYADDSYFDTLSHLVAAGVD